MIAVISIMELNTLKLFDIHLEPALKRKTLQLWFRFLENWPKCIVKKDILKINLHHISEVRDIKKQL